MFQREETSGKKYYFTFMIAMILYFMWIGIRLLQNPQTAGMWIFYAVMLIISLAVLFFDWLTIKRFRYVDTITAEKTPIPFKYTVLIGVGIAIFFAFKIVFTQTAFVPYPQFATFKYDVINSVASAVAGWIENMFFFSFILTSLTRILETYLSVMAYPAGGGLTITIFTVFHSFVYALNPVAMTWVFIFGAICVASTLLFKTLVVADALHISNNFIASMINAKVALVIQ